MTVRILVAVIAIIAAAFGIGVTVADNDHALARITLARRTETAAHADGRYNIAQGDAAYQPPLDRDNDGIACES